MTLVCVVQESTGYKINRSVSHLLNKDTIKEKAFLSLKSKHTIYNLNLYLFNNKRPYKILTEEIKHNGEWVDVEFTNRFGEKTITTCLFTSFRGTNYTLPILEYQNVKVFTPQEAKQTFVQKSLREHNYYIDYEDYMEVVLFSADGIESGRTKIDNEDFDRTRKACWSLRGCDGYVCGDCYLHRFVMNCPDDMYVDHINHDKLDNRKSNLRVCTNQENNFNKHQTRVDNTSGVTGVGWSKKYGCWRARISKDGEETFLGNYSDINEAKQARRKAEIEYGGEFAPDYSLLKK